MNHSCTWHRVANRLVGFAIAVLFLSLSGCSRTEQVVLKLHHFAPPTAPMHKDIVVPWCERIETESKGELKCQIYPAMQLGGSPTQLYDQVKDGVVDVVFTVPGFSAGRFPGIGVFELPFMMTDAESTSKALWDYAAERMREEFADVRPLAFNVHGAGLFHLVGKPVTRGADLRGLKIRAPTRPSSQLIKVLGGTPVGMPLPQIPEALAKGVIDGVVIPWEIVPAVKVNELTRYHSETDQTQPAIYTTVFLFAMNKESYQRLSAKQRDVIDANSGIGLSATFGKVMQEADAHGRATVPVDSINVIPKAEIERWIKVTQPVVDAWVDDMYKRGVDGKSLLASARSLTKKYSH